MAVRKRQTLAWSSPWNFFRAPVATRSAPSGWGAASSGDILCAITRSAQELGEGGSLDGRSSVNGATRKDRRR
eukprot:scaffold47_cov258-Pinguiococcus_pyrenoidosus.AAC.91